MFYNPAFCFRTDSRPGGLVVSKEFWKTKTLKQLSQKEWESLCDGCGKCCLHKIEDEDTGEIHFTNVACKLLDPKTGLCSNYKHRKKHVPDCHQLTPKKIANINWLPSTCAYRLVDEGRDLPSWHHLKTGSKKSIIKAGVSVAGRTISENSVKHLERHVVEWID